MTLDHDQVWDEYAEAIEARQGHYYQYLLAAWRQYKQQIHTGGHVADVIGDLEELKRSITAHIKLLTSEETEPSEGQRWRRVEHHKATRSYNWSRIISDYMAATGCDYTQAMRDLIAEDVLRPVGQWTRLGQVARRVKMPLTLRSGIVSDGDNVAVGEVWSTYYSTEAIPED
jgi:hypothetical protein